MKTRDCLFGQIRGTNVTFQIPPALSQLVVDQKVITWNNTTGMNPLWKQVPDGTIHCSYEEMFNQSSLPSVNKNPNFTDGMGNDVFMAKVLGQWWHIQTAMNLPDALDYDYTVFRQTDTGFATPHARKYFKDYVVIHVVLLS